MIVPGLVLASSSEWRLALLEQIGITPEFIVPHTVDEVVIKGELSREYCKRISVAKAMNVFQKMPDNLVLGADTVASVGRMILTKPRDKEEVRKWLSILSGRRHNVYTTVCLCAPGKKISVRQVRSILKFKRLGTKEIEWYVDSNDWQGKAGGYGINSMGAALIKWISGSHSAVAGLPLCETRALLENYLPATG